MADPQGVLITQDQRSLVTVRRIKSWRSGRHIFRKNILHRDPAVNKKKKKRMANITSVAKSILEIARPGHSLKVVEEMWEAVDEKQL